ncbi:putative monogalactosyldiacylglycerol synthase, chloroplastic [Porphyridium purpureum]|uniref:monogalactosyldiacylglycerol synthase n=1 Tax=Porphyridium purpureum TaxID=35688 RepID=A0A5J4Z0J6_PORPP|nr:putative monogalactosyldiacylglycerol synthase, chloroplastic [Porphyridium purpureum]|eukprot:POR3423..scf208_2
MAMGHGAFAFSLPLFTGRSLKAVMKSWGFSERKRRAAVRFGSGRDLKDDEPYERKGHTASTPLVRNVDLPTVDAVLKTKRRLMVLMSDTGGGHRASAIALSDALHALYPADELEIIIVDFFVSVAGPPLDTMPELYAYLAKHPNLWRLIWLAGQFPPTRWIFSMYVYWLSSAFFEHALDSFRPHLIVSVHPLCQSAPLEVLKRRGLMGVIPFLTVVTDLGSAANSWFHKNVDLCIVPSERVRRIGLAQGVHPDKLFLVGLPVRKAFWKRAAPKWFTRLSLGLPVFKKTRVILMVGGGDGVGNMESLATAVTQEIANHADRLPGVRLVVICGKNAKLEESMRCRTWSIPVEIHGFVTNMADYMCAADVIVTKAGPGTIAESWIRGLPVMLSSFLPGQEAGNVELVVKSGSGACCEQPKKLARVLRGWIGDDQALKAMSRASRAQGTRDATLIIARILGQYAFHRRSSLVLDRQNANPFVQPVLA